MKLKRPLSLAAAIGTVGLAIFSPLSADAQLSREKGAIYFEDFVDEKIEVLAVKQIPIWSTAQKRSAVGHLRKGRKVEILAMTEGHDLYMIRGMALHGQVKGWVSPAALTDLGKDFVKNMNALVERKKVVDDLIANNEIALGMKIEEVVASLGKPSRKTSKLTKEGRSDIYEYITYDRVPQYQTGRNAYGQLVRQKVYVKVETGKLSVTFKDEMVESIEEVEGDPLGGADVKIVPLPVELYLSLTSGTAAVKEENRDERGGGNCAIFLGGSLIAIVASVIAIRLIFGVARKSSASVWGLSGSMDLVTSFLTYPPFVVAFILAKLFASSDGVSASQSAARACGIAIVVHVLVSVVVWQTQNGGPVFKAA